MPQMQPRGLDGADRAAAQKFLVFFPHDYPLPQITLASLGGTCVSLACYPSGMYPFQSVSFGFATLRELTFPDESVVTSCVRVVSKTNM